MEQERILEFLGNLNLKLDQAKAQIRGLNPLPSLREVCARVCSEKCRRAGTLGPPTREFSPKHHSRKLLCWITKVWIKKE